MLIKSFWLIPEILSNLSFLEEVLPPWVWCLLSYLLPVFISPIGGPWKGARELGAAPDVSAAGMVSIVCI